MKRQPIGVHRLVAAATDEYVTAFMTQSHTASAVPPRHEAQFADLARRDGLQTN
jgi:hypothetical protein